MKKINSKLIGYDLLNDYKDFKNWTIFEKEFNVNHQGKFETLFTVGNGYISSRGCHEGRIGNKRPGTFVSGTFNKISGPEVSEIPNAADLFDFDLEINGEYVDSSNKDNSKYIRFLNLKNGVLTKRFVYTDYKKDDAKYDIKIDRFISLKNIHLICQKIRIKATDNATISFKSGINGQMTNSGANHFEDTYSEYIEDVLNYVFTTTNSRIDFIYHKKINFYINNKKQNFSSRLSSVYGYSRRKLIQIFDFEIKKDDLLEIELISTLHTTNDKEHWNKNLSYKDLNDKYRNELIDISNKNRFNTLFLENENEWLKYWEEKNIKIDTDQDFDILAIRFAQYQIRRFTPYHDNRCNIEAKGMAGEEYKGHTFWDTEIFIYPYFLYTEPNIAKQLIEHRYFVKNSALIKAKEFNYKGYMWPWETSWINDGETCPVWGAVDRKEGHRIKVWPAFNQHHIGSCIYWAIDQYYKLTNDVEFMYDKGFDILINTAIFWVSRLEYNFNFDKYEILKVTGPNEYKENIDNNVFTNYMAWYSIKQSINYLNFIKCNRNDWFEKNNINFLDTLSLFEKVVNKIYLPKENEKGIIPENDSFLSLKELNMDYYKENPDQLWKDYTFPELNGYQVLKQADLIALFYTLGYLFNEDTIYRNWKFYEHRCLHHSSLSLSLHAVTANYVADKNLAYPFFEKSIQIDLGPDLGSCDNGIHAASIGGILKIVIEGFGGIKCWDKSLSIDPNLPDKWNSLSFNFYYDSQKINLKILKDKLILVNLSNDKKELTFKNKNNVYSFTNKIEVLI